MRMRYDPQADALYLRLSDAAIEHSEEVEPGVILDYDEQERLVGIELLDVSKRVAPPFSLKAELEIQVPAGAPD